jgi:hypothetical protein
VCVCQRNKCMNKQIDKWKQLSHPKIREAKQMRIILFERAKSRYNKRGTRKEWFSSSTRESGCFCSKQNPHTGWHKSPVRKSPMSQSEPVAIALQTTHRQLNISPYIQPQMTLPIVISLSVGIVQLRVRASGAFSLRTRQLVYWPVQWMKFFEWTCSTLQFRERP